MALVRLDQDQSATFIVTIIVESLRDVQHKRIRLFPTIATLVITVTMTSTASSLAETRVEERCLLLLLDSLVVQVFPAFEVSLREGCLCRVLEQQLQVQKTFRYNFDHHVDIDVVLLDNP